MLQSIHIDWSLFIQNIAGGRGFVIECDVCTDFFEELDLLVGARRSNHFEAFYLGELNNEPVSRKKILRPRGEDLFMLLTIQQGLGTKT